MSAVPFMQLYVADYLGDTQHLTTEQHGAYLLILMAMWRAGGALSDDATRLARIARVSPARWKRVGSDVLAFFDHEAGKLTQKRLRREIEKASDISRKRSSAGARGGTAKALKTRHMPMTNAKPLPANCQQGANPLPPHLQNQDSNTTIDFRSSSTNHGLRSELYAAGSVALRRPALTDVAEPRRWLAEGCDLNADILAVIAARCRNRTPDSVRSWSYFGDAVFEARDRRLAGQSVKEEKRPAANFP